jgi:hypothetical protein
VPKPTVEEIGARVRAEAQDHWDQGYSWYLLTIDGSANTAYLIQWVENVGLALGARWLGVGREGVRRLRRLRAAQQQHHRQLPIQATGRQTRAVSPRPLGASERLRSRSS